MTGSWLRWTISEMSQRAVLAARDLAVLSKGEVWVLHLREREMGVKTGALIPDESTAEANAAVAESVEVLTQAGVNGPTARSGTPFSATPRGRSWTTRGSTTPTSS